jgi:hypothetical protein
MLRYDGKSFTTAKEAIAYSQIEDHGIFFLPLGFTEPTRDLEKEDERQRKYFYKKYFLSIYNIFL